MDRDALLHDLAETERQMALGERELAEQQALIGELDRDGLDKWEALEALRELGKTQALHERRRQLILRALSPQR